MLKEYAVDPQVISSSFETCRYLVSQFGADKGRLISKFPKTWKRIAIAAADNLPDGFNKERVIEYLSGINDDWLTLIGSGETIRYLKIGSLTQSSASITTFPSYFV